MLDLLNTEDFVIFTTREFANQGGLSMPAASKRLTRLSEPAMMRTFDVTPDGAAIIFDRLRRNSDLVLIEIDGGT